MSSGSHNAQVAEERAKLNRMRRGPEWQSLILNIGDPRLPALPVFGLRPTPRVRQLFERYDEEHTFESGWVLIRQDGPPEGWLDIEFYDPLYVHITLLFTPDDVAIMQALLGNGGTFLLAIDKDRYKEGHAIQIEDVSLDVPAVLASFAEKRHQARKK